MPPGQVASVQCLDGGSVLAGQEGDQGGVLVAVGDRVQAQRCRLGGGRDLGRVQPQPPVAVRMGGVDRDPGCLLLVTPGQHRVGIRAQLAQADEVGVRIEHDHPQVRLDQQPLQDDAERVGLARSRLAAQEGVPAEAPGVGQARHPGGQGQVAQPQHRVGLGVALLPGLHLRLGGDPDQRVMERGEVAVDDDAFAARVPEMDLGPGLRGALGGGRQGQFRSRLLVEFESEDLAEAGNAAVLQHGIAADLQLQGVQGGLEGEEPTIKGGGERKDGRLDVPARPAEAVQLLADSRPGIHSWIRANRCGLGTHPPRVIARPSSGSYKGNVVIQASASASRSRGTTCSIADQMPATETGSPSSVAGGVPISTSTAAATFFAALRSYGSVLSLASLPSRSGGQQGGRLPSDLRAFERRRRRGQTVPGRAPSSAPPGRGRHRPHRRPARLPPSRAPAHAASPCPRCASAVSAAAPAPRPGACRGTCRSRAEPVRSPCGTASYSAAFSCSFSS